MDIRLFLAAMAVAMAVALGARTFEALTAFAHRQVACVRSALDLSDGSGYSYAYAMGCVSMLSLTRHVSEW